ncbi:unnamed protein product, partial [Vitis vinifera]
MCFKIIVLILYLPSQTYFWQTRSISYENIIQLKHSSCPVWRRTSSGCVGQGLEGENQRTVGSPLSHFQYKGS